MEKLTEIKKLKNRVSDWQEKQQSPPVAAFFKLYGCLWPLNGAWFAEMYLRFLQALPVSLYLQNGGVFFIEYSDVECQIKLFELILSYTDSFSGTTHSKNLKKNTNLLVYGF